VFKVVFVTEVEPPHQICESISVKIGRSFSTLVAFVQFSFIRPASGYDRNLKSGTQCDMWTWVSQQLWKHQGSNGRQQEVEL
jgi:hypothetical protein